MENSIVYKAAHFTLFALFTDKVNDVLLAVIGVFIQYAMPV